MCKSSHVRQQIGTCGVLCVLSSKNNASGPMWGHGHEASHLLGHNPSASPGTGAARLTIGHERVHALAGVRQLLRNGSVLHSPSPPQQRPPPRPALSCPADSMPAPPSARTGMVLGQGLAEGENAGQSSVLRPHPLPHPAPGCAAGSTPAPPSAQTQGFRSG